MLALLAAVAVIIVVLLGAGASSPKAAGNPSTGSGATTVQRRDLVETDTESGTLSYAHPQTAYNRLSGTLTWLPAVGQVIKPGQPLFKVDGRPVLLMNGAMPAYRDLGPADSAGQDILQLNRNLVALGFNPEGITVNDTWQAATTAGVDVLQAFLGETETGILSLGQIVFLPGDQLVSKVDATLGATGGATNASGSTRPSTAEFVSLDPRGPRRGRPHQPEPTQTAHPNSNAPGGGNKVQTLQALIALLQAEIAELKARPNSPGGGPSNARSPGSSNHTTPPASNSGKASPPSNANPNNGGSGNPTAILETTSTQLIVTVDLDASKQSEAKVGERVTVEMPGGNTVEGRISAVSPVAQSSSNSGSGNGNSGNSGNSGNNSNSGSTVPVTITLSGHQSGAGLDQAAVSVNFSQARASNVLSVPVTALLATAGGGYAVQEAAAPHALVPVTTGLFAAGYVQISGSGLYDGLQVTDSQG